MGSRDLFSDVEVRDWTLLVRASSGLSSYRHYRRISKDLAKFLQKTNTRIILSAGAAVNYLILYNNTNTTQSGWQLTRSNINFVITETKSLLDWQNDQFGSIWSFFALWHIKVLCLCIRKIIFDVLDVQDVPKKYSSRLLLQWIYCRIFIGTPCMYWSVIAMNEQAMSCTLCKTISAMWCLAVAWCHCKRLQAHHLIKLGKSCCCCQMRIYANKFLPCCGNGENVRTSLYIFPAKSLLISS